MMNYIKADLYRIGTQVSFYVWCLASVVVLAFSVFATHNQFTATAMMGFGLGFTFLGLFIFIFAIFITEHTLRTESQYGLFKNDTTSGVSRTGIYLSKLMCGFILMVLMWVLYSVACAAVVAFNFTLSEGFAFLQKAFGLQGMLVLLKASLYLALFQALSVVIKTTPILVLVYFVVSMILSSLGSILGNVIPQLSEVLNCFDFGTAIENTSFIDYIPALLLMLLGGVAVTVFGNILFARKEL